VLFLVNKIRGQISFESLMLLLVVITSTAYVGTLFFQTNDVTTSYGLIRSELLLQINQKEEIIIEEVFFLNEEKPTFYVKTIPPTLTSNDLNLEKIYDLIESSTQINNPLLIIN
jgi:uncharacterized protein (UPF0333 family)